MNPWPEVPLGDLFSIKHGFAFKGAYFSDQPGPIVLTPGNFAERGGLQLRAEKDRSYTGTYPSEFMLEEGDLLVVMTDLTQDARILGSPAFIPASGEMLHNQRLGKIVNLDERRIDRSYLYHLMNYPEYREYLRATATGSTVKHTSPGRICAYRFALPPLRMQERIAEILSTYDDLIEVNRRRIALLESMARGLFDKWFVRFRFPGHEKVGIGDTPEGPLPNGWRRAALGELASDMREAVMPSNLPPETRYVGLEHIPRRSITLNDYGRAGAVESLKLRFQRGDVLFGKIRPYFHKVVWAAFDGIASSDTIILRPKKRLSSALLVCVASSDPFVAHAVQTSNGTKMPRANWSVLKNFSVPVPADALMNRFDEAVMPLIEAAAVLQASNEKLAAARDLLLPRLLPGRLTLRAAMRELAEAA